MKIKDKRETSSWLPAVPILEAIVPLIKKEYLVGIDSVVLLDRDYHGDRRTRVAGRYLEGPEKRTACIELYLDHLSELPLEARNSRMYLTYLMSRYLMHELYHHVMAQGKKRKLKHKQEEKAADKWSLREVGCFFEKLFPANLYEEEWNRIQKAIEERIRKRQSI